MMSSCDPKVIVRLGSHAEKEYLDKTVHLLDGLIVGANLIEATPGATASLLVKFGGKKLGCPFYLDPMTYAFGSYDDRDTGKPRTDLNWIKSDQKLKGSAKVVRAFKRSYRNLAEKLGDPFAAAIKRSKSVEPDDFADAEARSDACGRVARYQLDRVKVEFGEDPEYASLADNLPLPAAVFAPYFYIEPEDWRLWTDLAIQLAANTASLGLKVETHMVVCADVAFLSNAEFLASLRQRVPETGAKGVWLWFSRFNEHAASIETLRSFRLLVERLSDAGIRVFNMHGGYFSLALSRLGLSGTSHGVGYGEQKDVMPVIGQSTPTVRYYLREIFAKIGVAAIERAFDSLGVKSPTDFHRLICDCVICKGIVSRSIDDFRAFGETHYSRPQSERKAQTPAAAKRCRFHFMLSRIHERDWLMGASIGDVVRRLAEGRAKWSAQPSVMGECVHLARWQDALG